MYADTGLNFYPYFQNFSQDVHHLDLLELCHSHQSQSSMSSRISEYDMGGEGDLFKAAEPIIEEQVMSIDPMTAAISMMSCVDPTQDALESLQLFGEDAQLSQVMDMAMQNEEDKLMDDSGFQKSVSSGCLRSMEWINAMRPSFLDFSELDFGMRRAFSEGDIKALGNGNNIHPSIQRPPVVGSCTSEDRLQKLSRYRNKKSKRNFGRKIKYACRKALADSQPRIRGRFAKTEETEKANSLNHPNKVVP